MLKIHHHHPISFFQFSVNVYNPLARSVTWPVRLPVNGSSYSVSDASGKSVDCQVSVSQHEVCDYQQSVKLTM